MKRYFTIIIPTSYIIVSDLRCELNDNQYYYYGDYQTIDDVSSPTDCCKLCKDDPICINFSYGKLEDGSYSRKCYLKRGGDLGRNHEFLSSPKNISGCSCEKGDLI